MNAILFYAHGSADPLWRVPFDAIVMEVRNMYVVRLIELAFQETQGAQLDFDAALDSLIAQGATQVRVVPLFIAQDTAQREALKSRLEAAQRAHPQVVISAAPLLGDLTAVRAAIASAVIAGL